MFNDFIINYDHVPCRRAFHFQPSSPPLLTPAMMSVRRRRTGSRSRSSEEGHYNKWFIDIRRDTRPQFYGFSTLCAENIPSQPSPAHPTIHPSQEVCTILPQPLSRWLIPIIITIIITSSGFAAPFQIPIVCAFNIPGQRDTDTIHTISVTYCSPSPPPPTQCACHCPPQTRIPQPTYNFHCWVTPPVSPTNFHFPFR